MNDELEVTPEVTEEVETNHVVTQEDLDLNEGALEQAGVNVGDEVYIPTEEEAAA